MVWKKNYISDSNNGEQIVEIAKGLPNIIDELNRSFGDIDSGKFKNIIDELSVIKNNITEISNEFKEGFNIGNFRPGLLELKNIIDSISDIDIKIPEPTAFQIESLNHKISELVRLTSDARKEAEGLVKEHRDFGNNASNMMPSIENMKHIFQYTSDSVAAMQQLNQQIGLIDGSTRDLSNQITSTFQSLHNISLPTAGGVYGLGPAFNEINDTLSMIKQNITPGSNYFGKLEFNKGGKETEQYDQLFSSLEEAFSSYISSLTSVTNELKGTDGNFLPVNILSDLNNLQQLKQMQTQINQYYSEIENFFNYSLDKFKEVGNEQGINYLMGKQDVFDKIRSQELMARETIYKNQSQGINELIIASSDPSTEYSMIKERELAAMMSGGIRSQMISGFRKAEAARIQASSIDYGSYSDGERKNINRIINIEGATSRLEALSRLERAFDSQKDLLFKTFNEGLQSSDESQIQDAVESYKQIRQFILAIASQTQSVSETVGPLKAGELYNETNQEVKSLIDSIAGVSSGSVNLIKLLNVLEERLELAGIKVEGEGGENVTRDKLSELSKEFTGFQHRIDESKRNVSTLGDAFDDMHKKMGKLTSSVQGFMRGIGMGFVPITAGALLGYGTEVLTGPYKDHGQLTMQGLFADYRMGGIYDQSAQRDRIINQGIYYNEMSSGQIALDEYQRSWMGLRSAVGGQYGLRDKAQAQSDIELIHSELFLLNQADGISDSTYQSIVSALYKEHKMGADETAQSIKMLAETARTSNVPIQDYIGNVAELARQYKSLGLTGDDSRIIMEHAMAQGMTLPQAQRFASSIGSGMVNFAENSSQMGVFGMLSGGFDSVWSAIRHGIDRIDQHGDTDPNWGRRTARALDTQLSMYSSLAGGNEDIMFKLVRDRLTQIGFSSDQASMGTNLWIESRKVGNSGLFEEWLEDTNPNEVVVRGHSEMADDVRKITNAITPLEATQHDLLRHQWRVADEHKDALDKSFNTFRDGVEQMTKKMDRLLDLIMPLVESFFGSSIGKGITNFAVGNPDLVLAASGAYGLYKGYRGIASGIGTLGRMFGGAGVGSATAGGGAIGGFGSGGFGGLGSAGGAVGLGTLGTILAAGGLAYSAADLFNEDSGENKFASLIGGLSGAAITSKFASGMTPMLAFDAIYNMHDPLKHSIQGNAISQDMSWGLSGLGIDAVLGTAGFLLTGGNPLGAAGFQAIGEFSGLKEILQETITGFTKSEIELKRDILFDTDNVAKKQLEEMGFNENYAKLIVEAMRKHSDTMKDLSEEEKLVWGTMYANLRLEGMSNESAALGVKGVYGTSAWDNLKTDIVREIGQTLGYSSNEQALNAIRNRIGYTDDIVGVGVNIDKISEELLHQKINESKHDFWLGRYSSEQILDAYYDEDSSLNYGARQIIDGNALFESIGHEAILEVESLSDEIARRERFNKRELTKLFKQSLGDDEDVKRGLAYAQVEQLGLKFMEKYGTTDIDELSSKIGELKYPSSDNYDLQNYKLSLSYLDSEEHKKYSGESIHARGLLDEFIDAFISGDINVVNGLFEYMPEGARKTLRDTIYSGAGFSEDIFYDKYIDPSANKERWAGKSIDEVLQETYASSIGSVSDNTTKGELFANMLSQLQNAQVGDGDELLNSLARKAGYIGSGESLTDKHFTDIGLDKARKEHGAILRGADGKIGLIDNMGKVLSVEDGVIARSEFLSGDWDSASKLIGGATKIGEQAVGVDGISSARTSGSSSHGPGGIFYDNRAMIKYISDQFRSGNVEGLYKDSITGNSQLDSDLNINSKSEIIIQVVDGEGKFGKDAADAIIASFNEAGFEARISHLEQNIEDYSDIMVELIRERNAY